MARRPPLSKSHRRARRQASIWAAAQIGIMPSGALSAGPAPYTTMQQPEKSKVLQSIRDLGRRVTAADVATKTGLPLHLATFELNSIAAETGGHLEVATTGDIAYRFPVGFQNAYLTKGIRKAFEEIAAVVFKVGFYLLRISFGIMLILSLLVIMLLLLALLMRGSNDRDDGRFNFRLGFFDWMILRDLLYWGSYAGYPSPYQQRSVKRHDANFLLSCFSFLFGDGNPNVGLEDEKWKLTAQGIRAHKGVVTAEQLAPYLGSDPKNEDAVLPVLVRFQGRPEVTDSGNIVYVFPSLQVSAAAALATNVPEYLEERRWKFSNAPVDALVPVYILAGINFLGSWFLFFNLLGSVALSSLAIVILPLVAYGTFFVLVPLVRWMVQEHLNGRIGSRNARREQAAKSLRDPGDELLKKLGEAQRYQIEAKTIESDEVVYTTERDALEQEFDNVLDFEPGSKIKDKQIEVDKADA